MKLRLLALLLLAVPALAAATKTKKSASKENTFYVYADKGSMVNHFAASGWMGDYGDLKINDAFKDNCADGKTCIRWDYTAKGAQGANWAGVYWQQPPNNWGNLQGGYDLTGFKKFTFWAKGAKGGEILKEVKIGGIAGEYPDSGQAYYEGEIALTKDWKKYTIDLAGVDLTHINGGFCWVTNADAMPNGMTIFLDEIRYER